MTTVKELEVAYSKAIVRRVKVRRYGGDDCYSWAVFKDGRPYMTGLSHHSADYTREQLCADLHKANP